MKQTYSRSLMLTLTLAGLCQAPAPVLADETASATPSYAPDMGKLLATGGVSTVEGSAGGGITPWALIAGYGTRDSYGANVHATYLETDDFQLDTYGFAVGIQDRIEFSVARQDFKSNNGPLDGLKVSQNIYGVKLKIAGHAVYDQNSWMPQIAVGAEYKRNGGLGGLINAPVTALGAKGTTGTDYYVSATKLYLDQSLLANVTVRETKANQMGLLGFGGDLHDHYQPQLEGSLAYLVTRNWVVGAEYRQKPRNLTVDKEAGYSDVFLAWFPNKNLSLTLAYANLGSIVAPVSGNSADQKGAYLSLQAGF